MASQLSAYQENLRTRQRALREDENDPIPSAPPPQGFGILGWLLILSFALSLLAATGGAQ